MKKKYKVSLNEAADDIAHAYIVREFELGKGFPVPKRTGANELVLEVHGEKFLIKVTRCETSK